MVGKDEILRVSVMYRATRMMVTAMVICMVRRISTSQVGRGMRIKATMPTTRAAKKTSLYLFITSLRLPSAAQAPPALPSGASLTMLPTPK